MASITQPVSSLSFSSASSMPAQHVMQLTTGYMVSSALHLIVSHQIADLMANGFSKVTELARLAHVDEDALYRVMRLLASYGIFRELEPRAFALTSSGALLRRDRVDSLAAMVKWLADPFHFRVYASAGETMRSGVPAVEHAMGAPIFDYLATDPAEQAVFNDAMTGFSEHVAEAFLDGYDLSAARVVVDVAGGLGHLLHRVLQRHGHLHGVLFDLPHVIADATPRWRESGMERRADLVAGNFFLRVPRGGDAYLLKFIIHDWDDPQALLILRHVREALEGVRGGRVILLETLVGPGDEPGFGKILDYEMLMLTGGRERTETEYRGLLAQAGFALTRVARLDAPLHVIEGTAC